MNILGISTSPRRGGNTDLLLDAFLAGSQAAAGLTEKIYLDEYQISPCTHCDYCLAHGDCCIRDDMPQLYPRLFACDALVLAAPIYFMAHCAQAKLLIDRCQVFWARKYVLNETPGENSEAVNITKRRGIFISVGASHGPKVFAGAKVTMQWLFDSLRMEYWGNLLIEGCDQKGAIRNHPAALAEAEKMGRDLVATW